MPIDLRLRPSAGTPLYRQIVDEVRSAFVRGLLTPGEKLPSVRELSAQLGVNPTTVVKAYDGLEAERLIVRRQGVGAFVAESTDPVIAPGEDEERLREGAAALALEGRRLGWSERRLVALFEDELRGLRPEESKKRPQVRARKKKR